MKITNVTSQIVKVTIEDPELLAKTFIRFQEYYESPEFRNKIFTLGQFKDWYSKKYGAFTYYSDWDGFNIPSHVLQPFVKGLFDPLTDEEKNMLECFKYRSDKFYIIGVSEDSGDTLDHEICHGLYHTNDEYNGAVNKVLTAHAKDLSSIYDFLKRKGYSPAVWKDEANAYIANNYDYFIDEGVQVNKTLHNKLSILRGKVDGI